MNRSYYGWLAGSTLSAFGDSALFFALGWAATGIAPHVAGLVLTAFSLPRAVLLLLGGVLGDRWGPRRMLLVCSAVVGSCCFALAAVASNVTAGLLLVTAAVVGTVDAFALPAAGALPRLFVREEELPRAMALRTSVTQIVTLGAGPVSGLIVAVVGLVGALVVDGVTFAVQFLVLLAIRPPYDVSPESAARSVVREAGDGIRVAWRDPVLRSVLLVVALVAAFVLPVRSLCVPLLARAHGWTASETGLVVGVGVAGGLIVTLLVARFGTFSRPGLVGGLGCLLAAGGIAGLGASTSVAVAVAVTFVQGVGVGIFTSHIAPVFVRSTPRSHLTRLQSLLSLAQTIPLLGSTNLLAALDIRGALVLSAATTAVAGVALLRLEPIAAAERRTAT